MPRVGVTLDDLALEVGVKRGGALRREVAGADVGADAVVARAVSVAVDGGVGGGDATMTAAAAAAGVAAGSVGWTAEPARVRSPRPVAGPPGYKPDS
jgi:hypothetical protein